MKQRYTKILSLLSTILILFGSHTVIADDKELVNIALNKTAVASDWEASFLPEYACDGINDNEQYTSWKDSGASAAPWLSIDLNLSYRLDSIVIEAKKGNTSEEERSNFEVYGATKEDFSDEELIFSMENQSIPKNGNISKKVKTARTFRYIKIKKNSAAPLSVGEIKVMAEKDLIGSAVLQSSIISRQPYFSDERKFFNYEDSDDFEDNGETLFLSALGIMQGFEDGNFYPYESVTKAEFTAYLMKMATVLKMSDAPSAEKGVTFFDVPTDHWANPYIEKAYQAGWVSGDGSGYFHPDKQVTAAEASKMLISALGYQNLAIAYGGYPSGYTKLANELEFFKNKSYYGEYINHIDCAIIIYNAMHSDYIEIDYGITEDAYDIKNISIKKTNTFFMTRAAGITEAIGVVDGVGKLSLTDSDPMLGDGKVSIENTVYRTDMAGIKELVGYSVKFWYMTDAELSTDFLIAATKTNRNKTVEFIFDDFIDSYDGKVFYYNDRERKTNITYRKNVDVVYNGRAYKQYNPEKLFDDFSSVLFIDNDADLIYDCIMMVRERVGIVNFVNLYEKKIYFKNSDTPLSFGENTIFTAAWDESSLSPDLLLENDVLTIVASENDEDGIDRVTVSRESVYGSVSMITMEEELKIKNKIYKISPNYTDADIGIGDLGYFYIDYHGDICYADIKDYYSGTYGYLVGISENTLDGYQIRIFTANGKMQDYNPHKTLNIDGETYRSEQYENIKYQLSASAQKGTYGQPIRYVVKNNTLRIIDTLTQKKSDGTDILTTALSNESVYYSSSGIFDARYPVSEDVVVMRIPENVAELDKYTLESISKFKGGYDYKFYGYTDNEDEELKYIVTYGEYVLERDSSLAVICDVFERADSKSEPKKAVKAFHNGKIATYTEDENGLILNAGIAVGDIVALSADSENILYGIEKRFYNSALPSGASSYAISVDNPVMGVSGEAYNVYQDYFMAYATVEKRTGNNIRVRIVDENGEIFDKIYNEDGELVETVKNNGRILFNATNLNICVYDTLATTVQTRVRAGSINDLIDENSGTPSKIVLKARNGNISFICVIK